jgi:hypothetical protein
MVVSNQKIDRPLIQAYGEEFGNYADLLQILEFPTGKSFWNATDAKVGIYIILAGKVRLLQDLRRHAICSVVV